MGSDTPGEPRQGLSQWKPRMAAFPTAASRHPRAPGKRRSPSLPVAASPWRQHPLHPSPPSIPPCRGPAPGAPLPELSPAAVPVPAHPRSHPAAADRAAVTNSPCHCRQALRHRKGAAARETSPGALHTPGAIPNPLPAPPQPRGLSLGHPGWGRPWPKEQRPSGTGATSCPPHPCPCLAAPAPGISPPFPAGAQSPHSIPAS